MNEYSEAPKTLGESGQPPETRIGDALEVQNRIQLLIQADKAGRSQRRALTKGLVDGNPPYRAGDLRAAGRSEACNVNWRSAESYLNNARSAFYDVFSEAPSFVTIRSMLGGARKRDEWSRIITEEFDRMVRMEDEDFDYEMQISQYEMVLYGCGPLMFEDEYSYCAIAVPHRNLLVPEYALSRQNKWEEAAVLVDYYAHDLYKRIRHPESAAQMGWDVPAVREAIVRASPRTQHGGEYATWEGHLQQLKNNSFGYSAQSNVIKCAHYFVREFPEGNEECGRITHGIVLLEPNDQKKQDFLFKRIGRFENWREVIHPMYYDNDGGGYHHSVTGMGVKMYSAMEAQNRLICNSYDKQFAPKIFFKSNSANADETMNIIKMGDWAKVPSDFDSVQIPVQSFMEEGLMFNRELRGMIASNLSQYRQNMEEKSGNPITAEEMKFRASNIAQLGKTQLNHYYNQLDWYYMEKYRRTAMARNKNMPYGRASMEFQERCKERGVPIEALRKTELVQATRIIGQGSPFMRQQAAQQLLGTSQLNPSSAGRRNIYKDFVASVAGQVMVERYAPEIADMPADDDNRAMAMMQVAGAKIGVPPVVSPNQNSQIFAETFMQAMLQSFESLEQGGNPMEVHQFVETLGPATVKHIQTVGEDPRNEKAAKQLQKDWGKIASMHDKLGARLEQMRQQQQQAQQMQQRAQAMQNGGDPEMQMKAAQMRADLALKKEKQDATLAMKGQQTQQKLATNAAMSRQKMAIADVQTASKIVNDRKAQEASEEA